MAAKPWRIIPLVLTVGDVDYTIDQISYDDGLTLIATVQEKEGGLPEDAAEDALYKLVMGDTWDQMRSDGLPYPVLFRAGTAALQFQTALVNGIDQDAAVQVAEQLWEAGLDPEAVAAWAAAIRNDKNQSETSKPSTSTGKGSGTRSRASTSGTTSRRATPRTASSATAKPARSSGRRSSTTGRSS